MFLLGPGFRRRTRKRSAESRLVHAYTQTRRNADLIAGRIKSGRVHQISGTPSSRVSRSSRGT